MGVDTSGYIPGCTPQRLLTFIKSRIDDKAKLERVMMPGTKSPHNLRFVFLGEHRTFSVHEIDLDEKKARELASEKSWDYKETDHYAFTEYEGLPNNTKGVMFSMTHWGSSEFLSILICSNFGGYVLLNDSVDEKYEKIDNRGAWIDYIFESGRVKN